MNTIRRILPLLLTTVLILGCGDEAPTALDTGITIADLVGSWNATSAVHTNNADAAQSFDVIANGGEARFTMLDDGRTRTWTSFGTVSDEWDAAVSIAGNTITQTPAEAGRRTRTWTVELEGNVLTLSSTNGEWDFTLSGAAPVSTTEVAVFVRS